MAKVRADDLLVRRQLAADRQRAQALILAGTVFVGQRRIDKAGETLADDADLIVKGKAHPYVSRGGVKLAGALDGFAMGVQGVVAADFGASTGGFTDCLLQRGALRVYAIDVGYGLLHDRLRRDERVVVMERTNARHLEGSDLPQPVDLVVIDASFIGMEKLLPAAHGLLRAGGEVVAMVKPQFQVDRAAVGKGGVVRDGAARSSAIEDVCAAAERLGFAVVDRADAVIAGPKGNRECFLRLRRAGP